MVALLREKLYDLIFLLFSAIFAASFTGYFFGPFRSFQPVLLFHNILILSN